MIEHYHALPKIKQDDILYADVSDMMASSFDPTHHDEWQKLRRANPRLADKILKEAYRRAKGAENQDEFLAFGTFIISLLNFAVLREQGKLDRSLVIGVDGADAGSLPSDEPGDDQPAE